MSGRDVERELRDFFERTQTPEPSVGLRSATAAARLQAGPVRRRGLRYARSAFSLVGLAACIVIAVGALTVVLNRGNSTGVGPRGTVSPGAYASPTSTSQSPSPSPRAASSPTSLVSMGPPHAFTAVGAMDAAYTLAAKLPDGRVLVTGDSSGVKPLAAELFDPATGRFSPTGSLNSVHTYGTATALADGRLLVAGGLDPLSMKPTNAAEIFDARAGTFTPTGSLAARQSGEVAILLRDGRVLVVGGDTGDATPTSAELYDPASGVFRPIAGPGIARYGCLATLLSDGRVLVAGGWAAGPANSGTLESLTSAEVFDPSTSSFRPVGSMSSRHSLGTLTRLQDGRVLAVGGARSAELFDPATGEFKPTGSRAVDRDGPPATLLGDGRVLVAGGSVVLSAGTGMILTATKVEYLTSAEIFDPRTGTFSATGSMSEPMVGATATLLDDGRVLMTGGDSVSAELYRP